MAIKNTRTARSYINTAATQLYSIFVFVFIFFSLLLYTTRKGWFVFLACLKPLSKRATKREARLDFVDGCATSTAGMDKIRQSVVVTQPLYCPFFVQRAHVYKKKKIQEETKRRAEDKKTVPPKAKKQKKAKRSANQARCSFSRESLEIQKGRRYHEVFTEAPFQEILLQWETLWTWIRGVHTIHLGAYHTYVYPQQPLKKFMHDGTRSLIRRVGARLLYLSVEQGHSDGSSGRQKQQQHSLPHLYNHSSCMHKH